MYGGRLGYETIDPDPGNTGHGWDTALEFP